MTEQERLAMNTRIAEMDKDPRVYFAAERTFLAWIRTGIALMGFGFVVARFGLFLRMLALSGHEHNPKSYGFSLWAGTGLVLAGVFITAASGLRHTQVIYRMNRGQSIVGKPSFVALGTALLLTLLGIAMVIFLLLVD